jgi:predicted permease
MIGRRAWRRLLRLGRPDPAADIDAEIESHLTLQVDDLVAEGWSPDAARVEALRRFGDRRRAERDVLTVHRKREASMRRTESLGNLVNDIRLAIRHLRRRPLFTLITVLVIALGIGANSAVFAVVDAALLRPLPFPRADELVYLRDQQQEQNGLPLSWPEFRDWERDGGTFLTAIMSLRTSGIRLKTDEGWDLVAGARVAGDPHGVAGFEPILGRWFTPAEQRAGALAVLLDEAVWRERFHASPDVIGTRLTLGPGSYTVIGVLPIKARLLRGDGGAEKIAVWMPETEDPSRDRGLHFLGVVGRLRPGVTFEQGQAATTLLADHLKSTKITEHGMTIQGARDALVGDTRPILGVLAVAALFVLLIVCANLASLFVSKFLERGREFAVRVALGAGRGRLVRLVLTESLLVGLAGGAVGLVMARAMIEVTRAAARGAGALAPSSSADLRVVAFTLGTALVVSVAFGLLAALRATRVDPAAALKEGDRSTAGGRGASLRRKLLVGFQVAVSFVLVAGAGLLLRSLALTLGEDPGFDPHNVLAARILLADKRFEDDAAKRAVLAQLEQRLAALPGVTAMGAATELPLDGGDTNGSFEIVGREDPSRPDLTSKKRVVGPGYFQAMRIPVLAGRAFGDGDRDGAPDVVIISESLRRQYWPTEDAVGKRVRFSWGPGDVQEIVGVVGDVHHDGLNLPVAGTMYRPMAQFPQRGLQYVIRTRTEPTALIAPLRALVAELDPGIALYSMRTVDSIVSNSTAAQRTLLFLLGGFAAIAVLLAAMGVYGVISLVVVQRTREIGVRIAVGAQRGDILKLVLGEAAWMLALGVAAGACVALAASRALAELLYRVSAADPLTFCLAATVLAAIGLGATYLPARRAARLDPLMALRSE